MTALNAARRMLNRFGMEAYRANPMTIWQLRLPKLLSHHGVRTVLDVGANDGGYASDLIRGGYSGRILSFEPLPDAWAQLEQRTREHPSWNVAPPMALSNSDGEADFHEAGNSVSSSLLAMTGVHTGAAPDSAPVAVHKVRTRRLDDFLLAVSEEAPYFLKIDVQGAEQLVLEGAASSLQSSVVGVQLEMSVAPLYDGQTRAADLDRLLCELGFECWDILPGFRDPSSLRMLQYDGIYFRPAERD